MATAKKTASKTVRNSKPKETPAPAENVEKKVVPVRNAKVEGIICSDVNGAYPHALATDALYIVEDEASGVPYPVAVVDIFGKRWYAKAEQVCRESL